MKLFKWILVIIFIAVLIGAAAFIIWAETPLGPMPEALAALESDDEVAVSVGEYITFEPADKQPVTGFIFYPGGRVDPRSYAPAAREIARQGYLAVIVEMPLNLAVFGSDRASQVIASHPEIDYWSIGGHSLGGSMAASFAAEPANAIDGLALWASYPPSTTDLSQLQLDAVSITASQDGLVDPEDIKTSAALLPADTTWVMVEGGNHAQFGWYGDQRGDNPASISRTEQQSQVVQATIELLLNTQD